MRVFALAAALVLAVASVSLAQPSGCEKDAAMLEAALHRPEARTPGGIDALMRRTRAALQREGDRSDACAARLRSAEMMLTGRSGDLAELEAALDRFAAGPLLAAAPPMVRMRYWRQRGYLYERRGRTAESASAYFEAARDAGSVGVLDAAAALRDAALSATQVGRYELSDRYYQATHRLLTDSLAEASGERQSEMRMVLGATYSLRTFILRQQHVRAALPADRDTLAAQIHRFSTRALATFDAAGAPLGTRDRLKVLLRDAIVWAEQGDDGAARARLAEAESITAETAAARPLDNTSLWIAWGDVEHEAGAFTAAQRWFERARDEAVRLESVEDEILALEGLGRATESRGALDEAERAYRQAIELREIERERIGLREWTASAFAERQTPYRGLSRVLLGRGEVRGALAALDASRARAFRDLRRFRQRHRTLAPDQRARVDVLIDSLEAIRERSAHASPDGGLQTPVSNARIAAYQDSIAREIGVEPLAAPPLDISALQGHLATEGRELVVYSIDRTQSTAYVVRPDTLVAVALPTAYLRIAEHVAEMMAPWLRSVPDPAADLDASYALYEAVFAPVEPYLSDGRPLTVVPDAMLSEVPLAMLTRAPAESYQDADYLVRHRAFTTDLAAGLLTDARRPSVPRPVLAFGRSHFGDAPSDLRPLPFVPSELAHVDRYADAVVALDAGATETALLEAAPTAGVVHLATHAVLDAELPMNSYVVLEGSPGDDGRLFLHELQNRDLSADLVVLSGCSTADGELASGEGLMGLGYAVRTAGAEASLATLWSVDDEATVALMAEFYQGLADGLGKDEALRKAQLAYLDGNDGLRASPFYWAAPVLSGVPGSVPMPAPRASWWLWVLAAGLPVGGLLAWRLARHRPPA